MPVPDDVLATLLRMEKKLGSIEKHVEDNLPQGDVEGDTLVLTDVEPLAYRTSHAYFSVTIFNDGVDTVRLWTNRPGRGRPVELKSTENITITGKRDRIRTLYLALKTSGSSATVRLGLLR